MGGKIFITDDVEKIFDNTDSEYPTIAFLLAKLDMPYEAEGTSKFPLASILRLYIFKIIKGFRTYELFTEYLNAHEDEAFQLGVFKNEDNVLEIPPKRTFNHYLKTKISGDQKDELDKLAGKIMQIASKKDKVLDINIVEKTIKEKTKNYDLEIKRATKIIKQIFYPKFVISKNHNAIYTNKDILDAFVHISSNKHFANLGAKILKENNEDKKCPSGDLLMYHLAKIGSIEEILTMFDDASDFIFKYAKKNYNLLTSRKYDIAYDIHKLKYFGKGMNYVCSSKFDGGTTNFLEFLTCSIVDKGKRFILDVVPIHPLDDLAKLLDRSLKKVKNRIHVERAYLDRGFNRIGIFRVLKQNKVPFLMPMVKNKRVKSAFDKAEYDQAKVFKDFKVGEESVVLTLVNDNAEVKRAFVSNFDVDPNVACELFKMYSKRWGIETAYRQIDHDFLARTTSKNYNIRLFYFLFSTCFFNLWVLVNIRVGIMNYGRVQDKPIIPGKLFGAILYKVQIEYPDPGG